MPSYYIFLIHLYLIRVTWVSGLGVTLVSRVVVTMVSGVWMAYALVKV